MLKEKIELNREKETLLIPLYCKAEESKKEDAIIKDEKAIEVLEQIEYDFSLLKVPSKTKITLSMRAKQFDRYVGRFIKRYGKCTIVHLGCGLDSRIARIGSHNVNWYDLDFPEVIELRSKFYNETDNYHFIPSSVTDFSWMDEVNAHGKILFVAEGLLMYLKEEEVKELFLNLHKRFPGSYFVFDVFSKFTAQRIGRHSSIRKTNAQIYWGVDHPSTIEEWGSGIKFIEEWHFTQSKELKKLPFIYKLAFKLADFFTVAKNAHRILYFSL